MQNVHPDGRSTRGTRPTRSTRTRRHLRWPGAVVALAALLTACYPSEGAVPTKTATLTGTYTTNPPAVGHPDGSLSSLFWNDDIYYSVGAGCGNGFPDCTDWIGTFDLDCVDCGPLKVNYKGKNAGVGYQTTSMWNFASATWVPVDQLRPVGTTEVAFSTAPPPGNPVDYVQTGSRDRDGFAWYYGVAVVRIQTIGSFSSTSADVLAVSR